MRAGLAYVCNLCTVSLHLVTSEAVDIDIACRNSKRRDGSPGSARAKRTLRSGSAQESQTSTICRWPSGQNTHGQRSLCVARHISKGGKSSKGSQGLYLDAMRFIKDKAMVMDRMNNTFIEVSCRGHRIRRRNSLTVLFYDPVIAVPSLPFLAVDRLKSRIYAICQVALAVPRG